MKKTVVILLSDKRSGSTMFQRELCKHPEIQTVAYSPHAYLETHHWLKAAVMLDVDPELFCGKTVYSGYGSKKNARTYMEDCVQGNIPDFKIPATDRQLVFQGWEALCNQFAQPVFFEKSPQFLAHWGCLELILEWMKETDYTVKIIGLIRNPLSVMYSAQELFHTDPEKRQVGWVEIYQNLQRFQSRLNPEQYMQVRYEDIIQDAVSTFSKIGQFIGVSACDAMGEGVHASSVNKWESDPFFTFRLSEPTKVLAREFGYSDHDLENPEKPTPSTIRRLKQKLMGRTKLGMARFNDQVLVPLKLRWKMSK